MSPWRAYISSSKIPDIVMKPRFLEFADLSDPKTFAYLHYSNAFMKKSIYFQLK